MKYIRDMDKSDPVLLQAAICTYCHKTKTINEFERIRESLKSGRCRACRNDISRLRQQRINAEANPHDYNECYDCDQYFYKYNRSHSKKQLHDKCPHCGSNDYHPMEIDEELT